MFPFHGEVIPNVSFSDWPYDGYHQLTDDLALVDHDLIDDLGEIGCAAPRSLANADPV